jgi:hypothetical protein
MFCLLAGSLAAMDVARDVRPEHLVRQAQRIRFRHHVPEVI